MVREKLLTLMKNAFEGDDRIVFAYTYGSFIRGESFRDVDIAIYVRDSYENPFVLTSDIKTELSRLAKKEGLNLPANRFDVQIINQAPFTFLKRIFKEGVLLVDRNPDLRTDLVEYVSFKYRECAGLLAKMSLL
jgi:predicted nucleotidyltransferase